MYIKLTIAQHSLELESGGRVNTLLHFNKKKKKKTLLHFILPTFFSRVCKRKIFQQIFKTDKNESANFYRSEQAAVPYKISKSPQKHFKNENR